MELFLSFSTILLLLPHLVLPPLPSMAPSHNTNSKRHSVVVESMLLSQLVLETLIIVAGSSQFFNDLLPEAAVAMATFVASDGKMRQLLRIQGWKICPERGA